MAINEDENLYTNYDLGEVPSISRGLAARNPISEPTPEEQRKLSHFTRNDTSNIPTPGAKPAEEWQGPPPPIQEPTPDIEKYGAEVQKKVDTGETFTGTDLQPYERAGIRSPVDTSGAEGMRRKSSDMTTQVLAEQNRRSLSDWYERALSGQFSNLPPAALPAIAKGYAELLMQGEEAIGQGNVRAATAEDIVSRAMKTRKETAALPGSYTEQVIGQSAVASQTHGGERKNYRNSLYEKIGEKAAETLLSDWATPEEKKKAEAVITNIENHFASEGSGAKGASLDEVTEAVGGKGAPKVTPTWEEFYKEMRTRNSKLTDDQLRKHYKTRYGGGK